MKVRPTAYTFDASEKTITCASFSSLEAIQLITNVTDGIIIYNFADPAKGGSLASTTLTLTYDTTSMSDTDKLMILLENGIAVRGTARGATDSGIPAMGVYEDADVVTSVDDGDYANLSLTHFKELRTRDQRSIDLCNCNDYTAVSVLGNDTINLANATNHVFGTGALTFDKANGAANTVFAGVSKTFTAINISEIFEAGGFVGMGIYLPALTNVVNVFLRIGTDASHYNCWTWDVADLTAATWLNLRKSAAQPNYTKNTGNGWNTAAIAYVAFGVEFSGETNTLAGIVVDHVHIVGGRVTASDISTAVSSTVTTPNVNINRVGGTATATGNGTVTAGTQRVTIASDSTGQVALAAGTNAIGKLASNDGVDIGDVGLQAGTNAVGKLLPPDIDVTGHTNYIRKYYTNAGAVTDGIIWSPAAGKRWHVTSLIFQTSADATITFEDDKAAGDDAVLKGEFKAGSGMALTFDEKYPFASGEDAADLMVTTSAGNIYISIVGYEI